MLLAEAYPASSIVGFDADDGSIDAARKRAADAGLADRVRFEVASAATFDGTFDLVCFFDCLHDMGDPAGACAHVREHLAPGGTLMLIEPFANDDLTDNLNPVGAAYYGFSTLLCTPSSLSQDVGTALGAQAGEARLRDSRHRRRVHDIPPGGRDTVQHRAGSESVMKFAQIIEFRTSRIDDFNANLDAWMTRTEGHRIPHRAVLDRDRDADDHYLLMVEFAVLRPGHGELQPPRDGGVRRVPGRDLRRTPRRSATSTCYARRTFSPRLRSPFKSDYFSAVAFRSGLSAIF